MRGIHEVGSGAKYKPRHLLWFVFSHLFFDPANEPHPTTTGIDRDDGIFDPSPQAHNVKNDAGVLVWRTPQ